MAALLYGTQHRESAMDLSNRIKPPLVFNSIGGLLFFYERFRDLTDSIVAKRFINNSKNVTK